jgi:1-deoxy-D-xylulose-5-phosphate synthase
MREIVRMQGPKLLHLHTTKGKGFAPAEEDATLFHAPGRFDPETGCRCRVGTDNLPTDAVSAQTNLPTAKYQDVFGETLLELALDNECIVGVTPAMPTGCSMNIMQRVLPRRVFDVGIAEGHAVTFSAGMAAGGLIPFCNLYSSFMQRAVDNVIHDLAINPLHVVICLDRAGLVGEDGATHHGVFDVALLRSVPNLLIAAPMDEHELRHMMYTAQLPTVRQPFVIRYPRGTGSLPHWRIPFEELPIGKGRRLKEGKDVAILTLGTIGQEAALAISRAEADTGRTIAHYDLRFAKPLDEALLEEAGRTYRHLIIVEDGAIHGGVGSAVLEYLSAHNLHPRVEQLGIPDHFIEHGTISQLRALCHIDAQAIYDRIIAAI